MFIVGFHPFVEDTRERMTLRYCQSPIVPYPPCDCPSASFPHMKKPSANEMTNTIMSVVSEVDTTGRRVWYNTHTHTHTHNSLVLTLTSSFSGSAASWVAFDSQEQWRYCFLYHQYHDVASLCQSIHSERVRKTLVRW